MMMETRRIASQTNRSVAIDTDLVQPEVLTSGSVTHRTEVTNIPKFVILCLIVSFFSFSL